MRIVTTFWWLLSCLCYAVSLNAQTSLINTKNNSSHIWKDSFQPKSLLASKNLKQLPSDYRLLELDASKLNEKLYQNNSKNLCLPLPDGSLECYEIKESRIMHPKLADKYPNIKTYFGKGIENPSHNMRFVWTNDEFHALIRTTSGTIFIDKVSSGTSPFYISYYSKDLLHTPSTCGTEDHQTPNLDLSSYDKKTKTISPLGDAHPIPQKSSQPIGETLRTYRLAMAVSGELTVSLGGVTAAMTRVTNIVSDLNLVFERELCMRFELIPNNDDYIFPDPETDPFSGASLSSFLGENLPFMHDSIGPANYDIGHVLNPFNGGVAYVSVICDNYYKSGGTSGNNINTIAHEFGHQFGAYHTFNYCGGSGGGYEPGSGNTIMSYAGNCPPYNMPGGDVFQYHAFSHKQITDNIHYGSDIGHICSSNTATGNTPPVITMPNSGFTIPISTPFTLTGSVTDDGGTAPLTYVWDQYDLGVNSTPPTNPTGPAPIFRTFPVSNSPSRTFPELSKIINGTSDFGEVLPTYTRDLNFRLLVHDNHPGGGGVSSGELMFSVDENAGPFIVTVPNDNSSPWSANQIRVVEWDVANTNIAPINCATVNILASFDGGYTYPDTLASGTANDGSEYITVPNMPGTLTRIKVEAADNIFFDISDTNFEILEAGGYDFTLESSPVVQYFCSANTANYELSMFSIGNYNSPVELTISGLPANATSNLPITVSPNSSGTVILSNLNLAANGHYEIIITATEDGGVLNKTIPIYLNLKGSAESTAGNAMSFDGDDNINIPQLGLDYQFGTNQSFSVETWFKSSVVNQNDFMVGNKDYDKLHNIGWALALKWGKVLFSIGDGSNRATLQTSNTYNDGKWHHVAAVYDRTISFAYLYIDGTLQYTYPNITLETMDNDFPITIGSDANNDWNFTGDLDEIRIWRKKLTESEVRESMHLSLDSCDPELISYYQFNESSGDVIDPLGFYNGTVNGAVRITSSAPIGGGSSNTQPETNGSVQFTGTNLTANYTEQNGASVTSSKINQAPYGSNGIEATYTILNSQYWAVNRYVNSGSLNADLTFEVAENITTEEAASADAFKLYSRTFNEEADWTLLASASSANANNNTLTFPAITSYGQYLIAKCGSCIAALPLNLISFEAIPKQRSIQLLWETELEYNIDEFEIMRSADNGNSWEAIGYLTGNNQLEKQTYSFIDNQVQFNTDYYYQLKIKDLNGTFEYSPIRIARISSNESLSIYPNPSKGILNIQLSNQDGEYLELDIYDSKGVRVFSQKQNLIQGKSNFVFDVSGLPPSFYITHIKVENSHFYKKLILER